MKPRLAAFFLLLGWDASAAYIYYLSETFAFGIDSEKWDVSGSACAGASGLRPCYGFGYGVSTISKVAVPDSTSEYEVKLVLSGGGSRIAYLRASADANHYDAGGTGAGTYYAVQFVPCNGYWCGTTTGTFYIYRRLSDTVTLLASQSVTTALPISLRAIIGSGKILVYTNGTAIISLPETAIASGKPGVGIWVADEDPGGISDVQFGPFDRTAPTPGSSQSVSSAALSNEISFQWQGGADGTNGTGLLYYQIFRNSSLLATVSTPEFVDTTVAANTTYTYQVKLQDYHGNTASMSSFQAATPVSGAHDPRSVGLRGSGSYWGGGGEQIDMRTGNLNFTIPLLHAQTRNGGGATFALNYNSQNWRYDASGTWKLGRDVGFGYGWKLLAGSITPYWSSYFTLNHFVFTDAAGTEYRMEVNSSGIWRSKESSYVWYNANTQKLYFANGTNWTMGQLSGPTEQDAGTRYPTVITDTNGSQIKIRYDADSARITQIEDVRATCNGCYTYQVGYSTVNGSPHLSQITNLINTAESYTFDYWTGLTLYSPFSPAVSYGVTPLLKSVTRSGINLVQNFEYNNTSGELTKVTFPYGGELRWEYRTFTYTSNRSLREVQHRKLVQQTGGTVYSYTITRNDGGDSSLSTHAWSTLDDADGVGRRKWYFETSGASAYFGLETQFEQISLPSTVLRRTQNTWVQDPHNRPYAGSVLVTLDPGQSYSKQMKVDQTLDKYGSVTLRTLYDYGNLTQAARTTINTYINASTYPTGQAYENIFIANRLKTSTLSSPTESISLFNGDYDIYPMTLRSGLQQWDSTQFNTATGTRGNLNRFWGYATPYTERYYDATGTLITNIAGGASTSITPTSDNTVPGTVTTGALSETMSWNSFLGLAQDTKPNSNQTSLTYDSYARPSTITSPTGATTTYTYTNSPPTTTATTNGKWTKTTYDGLGRPIRVDSGYGTTTVSIVESEYAPCACSPLGKLKKVSRPRAAEGDPKHWTVYTYDALGRTVSVQLPSTDGTNPAGTTTYVYEGNTVKTTDPAGKWKKFTMDAMGNLTQVNEPNPAGGADLVTTYTYNVVEKLKQVQMTRGSTTQTRTFNYDTDGRLTSMTQPETGTTTFTYNTDYTVATKVDAKNQKLAFTYDSYKRVTEIAKHPVSSGAEDLCQHVSFRYDSNPYDGSAWQNLQGRLAAVRWGGTACGAANGGGQWTEMFSYTSAGLTTHKRLDVSRGVNTATLASDFTYDDEGKLVTYTYPLSGNIYQYSFDSMGRQLQLVNITTGDIFAHAATYNAASQLTGFSYGPAVGWAETRTYNTLGQLTRLTVPTAVDMEYTFSLTQNNGRITKQKDWVSGEEVNYTYDQLNRLLTASTTSTAWGLSFGYDGFGNKLSQTVTKGSAPPMNVTVDAATNRLVGSIYDANGNLTIGSGLTLSYDISNRIATATGPSAEWYAYASDNKRVWKKRQTGASTYEENVYFYSVTGQRLGTYTLTDSSGTLSVAYKSLNFYFAGKLIKEGTSWVAMDRLGSVRARYDGALTIFDHFPYGEEKPSTTTQDRNKFATYFRDHTNLDYADQRYYMNTTSRFATPDPLDATAGTSGNLATYALGDPVNLSDPTGQAPADIWLDDPWVGSGCYDTFTSTPVPADASNGCPPGALWHTARPPGFGGSRLNVIRQLTEQLTEYIQDWDYSDTSGNKLDITLTPETSDVLFAGGNSLVPVAVGAGTMVIGGIAINVVIRVGVAGAVIVLTGVAVRNLPAITEGLKYGARAATDDLVRLACEAYATAKALARGEPIMGSYWVGEYAQCIRYGGPDKIPD